MLVHDIHLTEQDKNETCRLATLVIQTNSFNVIKNNGFILVSLPKWYYSGLNRVYNISPLKIC